MTPVWPTREQWWVIFATYAAVLFIQRENLREPAIATGFLIAGALLLMWRLSRGTAAPANADARKTVAAVVGVGALLVVAALVASNWSSPQDYRAPDYAAAPSSTGYEAPPSPPPYVRPDLPEQAPMTPSEYTAEYMANNFAAYEKYRDRVIQVVGEVVATGGSGEELAYVDLSLNPEMRPFTSRALFPKNAAQIEGLKKGDQITLSCTMTYDGDLENVTFNNCSVVK